jgi:hypothetical protein
MRSSLLGLLGAAVLGLAAVSAAPAPARAQGISIAIGEPHAHRPPPPVYREHRRFVPVYRHRYGPPVYATGSFRSPRCVIRSTRAWNGFGWVERRRRVCR